MTDEELLTELRGRVSGETGAELVKFFEIQEETLAKFYGTDLPDGSKYSVTVPRHEVVMDNGEHALLLKYEVKTGTEVHEQKTKVKNMKYVFEKQSLKDAKRPNNETVEIISVGAVVPVETEEEVVTKKDVPFERLAKVFYLAGINDEGKYFVHRMEGLPIEHIKSMEDVLSWANRSDEGFVKRLQGDILMQVMNGFTARLEFTKNGTRRSVMSTSNPVYYPVGEDEVIDRAQLYIRDLPTPFAKSTEMLYDTRNSGYDTGLFKKINLGNHVVSADGYMAVLKDQYVLVVGNNTSASTITIQHPEHGVVVQEVPAGHALILTGQRGRGLETKDGIQPSITRNAGFD